MLYWLLALFCVLLTTFFSVAFLVLRRVAWVKVEEVFEERNQPQRTQFLRARNGRLMVASAVYRLLANLGVLLCFLYIFSINQNEPLSAQELPLWEAFIVSALVLIIFAVAIPHIWAKYGGTEFLVRYYLVLWLVDRISYPFARLLRFFEPMVRRMAGLEEAADEEERIGDRQEDLLNVVEESTNQGAVDEVERDMIESVLEFRNTTAGEIMTPRTEVVAIEADTTIRNAIDIMLEEGHSRFPVFEDSIDRVIGLLYAKDLLRDLKDPQALDKVTIRQRLRKPFFVPESKTVRDLLQDFKNHKVHIAIVLDEYGGTAGVVTFEDILEELVGEITDEYEPPQESPIVRVNETTLEADARVHVDELNSEFELEIPESEDYETVGGFLFALLGHIPSTGETIEHDSLRFTVLDAEQRKINRVRIERIPTPTPEE